MTYHPNDLKCMPPCNKTWVGTKLVSTVVLTMVVSIVGMFFGFLVGLQLARGLGSEGYGTYGLALSTSTLLTTLVEFGIPRLLVREVAVAQTAGDWPKLLGIFIWAKKTALLIAVIVITILIPCLIIVTKDIYLALPMTMLVSLFIIPTIAMTNVYSATIRGLQYVTVGQIPDVLVRPLLHSTLLYCFVIFSLPMNSAIAMLLGVFSSAISLIVAVATLRFVWPNMAAHSVLRQIKAQNWWYSSTPFALSEIARILQGHLSILFLGAIAAVSVVGIFRVANSVYVFISFPSIVIEVVMAPIIARLYAQNDGAKLQQLLMWSALVMTSSTIALTMPFLIFGPLLLAAIFGEEFSAANNVLLILCLGATINACFGANFVLLNMTKHQERVTYATTVSCFLLALTSPFFIMVQRAEGAAVAYVLSMLVWNVLAWRDANNLLALDTSVIVVFKKLHMVCIQMLATSKSN